MIDFGYLVDRLGVYVATPSINPAFDPGGGEAPLAAIVAADLQALGIASQIIEPMPGRPPSWVCYQALAAALR